MMAQSLKYMNKKATIIYYTDSKLVGGAEIFLYLLLKNIDQDIYNLILICPNGKKHQAWRNSIKKLGVKVLPVATRNIFSVIKFYKIYNSIKSSQPEIIHFQFWSPYSCGVGLICAKLTKVPIAFSSEHSFVPLEEAEWYFRPIKKLYHQWRKNIIDYPTTVSLASKIMMQRHQSFGDKEIYVVHNGITPNDKEEKIGCINHKKTNLVMTARLEEGKGHNILIDAVSLINKKRRENLVFHLLGSGSLKKVLKNKIKKMKLEDNFKFWGERRDVRKILNNFDIFVFPSLSENFPFAILEAMDAGLPIIASNTGGIKEALKNGRGGYLIKKGNKKLLSQKIIEIVNNKSSWDKFGQFNKKLVRAKYSDKVMTRNIEVLYQKALKNNLA